MELHKAIKEIVNLKGIEIIMNAQVINFLLDYNAFKEKPATKLILRDVINSGYAEELLSLDTRDSSWHIKFLKYKRDFTDSCGYKEELVDYVFEAIAYGIGIRTSSDEPKIEQNLNIQSFFDIIEEPQQSTPNSIDEKTPNVNQSDLYSIAFTFYNEGKYKQAKTFIENSISLFNRANIPAHQLKLKGDINMKLGYYEEAIDDYNNSYVAFAKDKNIEIAKFRELLKNHEIKGFENSMFYYHFCLYSIGKISNELWLKLVRSEAMYGLNDAIMYCVNNGINPIESHIDIFFIDKDILKTGDYLYSDGTFAHELSPSKTVIASVIITETSKYEQSQGWNNGYLIPVNKDGRAYTSIQKKWSTVNEDLPFPHSHYTHDDINHWDKLKTIESEQYISINNFDLYPVFKAAKQFQVKIPIAGTSSWFVPSVHWFKRQSFQLTRFMANFISSWGDYWTSSQADATKAIHVSYRSSSIRRSYYIFDSFDCAEKSESKLVLPIAAF